MSTALRALLAHVIDYAGLFPPASLDLPAAARNYAAYLSGPHRWALGRFVLPAARLPELTAWLAAGPSPVPWRLSVLAGDDPSADAERLRVFEVASGGAAVIDAIEARASTDADVTRLAATWAGRAVYCEVPIAHDPEPLIEGIGRRGMRAKVRAGGVVPQAIPPTVHLARFIQRCAELRVPFKATAGLHHPVRAAQPLTYERGGPTAVMHGFLNLLVAAALAMTYPSDANVPAILEDTDPAAFHVSAGSIGWRGLTLPMGQIAHTREHLAIGIGSCSFDEPIGDLGRLGYLD